MTRLLNMQTYGDATNHPTLLIAHGLFGSGRNWRAIAKRLSVDRQVITVDMRNHAGSFWDDDHSYPALADDLARCLAEIKGLVDVLGHSMGGKAAMVLALRNPPNMNRLIVADIAPVTYTHSHMPNIKAMQAVDIKNITRRSEAEKMLADSVEDAASRAFLVQSLELTENDARWTLNLNALADNMDDIIGFPEITGTFLNDVLFIKGGLSNYVLPEHMPNIKRFFPNVDVQEIEGANHWVHAEKPRAFIEMTAGFLG